MNEEKTKIASYVVMFSLHMCSFIFADFQDKPMGAVSVFTNRNLSTANLTVRCCFVLCTNNNEQSSWQLRDSCCTSASRECQINKEDRKKTRKLNEH